MHRHIFLVIALFLLYGNAIIYSQSEKTNILLKNLEQAYADFNYAKTDEILNIVLEKIDSFSLEDQITIYKYKAIREAELGDAMKSKDYFWKILEIDLSFTMDPIKISPKILSIFQSTKIEFLENLHERLERIQNHLMYNPVPWRSLIFPGWEQLHREYKLKGYLWGIAGIVCLTGTVQAIIRTQQKYDEYKDAVSPSEIESSYGSYNRVYKSQFYWSYALLSVWLASHLDSLFFSPIQQSFDLTIEIKNRTSIFTIAYSF